MSAYTNTASSAVIGALFRKELRSFLGNPTGYVFLTLFIVASASAAFLTDSFFSRNLADLATLNRWMPAILMFFVPAVTMGLWADERRWVSRGLVPSDVLDHATKTSDEAEPHTEDLGGAGPIPRPT